MKIVTWNCFLLAAVLTLTGCGTYLTYQTTPKDLQATAFGDTKNGVKTLFYEGRPVIGGYYVNAAIKIENDGLYVVSGEENEQVFCDWAVGDPVMTDYGSMALDWRYEVSLKGCGATVQFKEREKALQFAKLLYTLKQQAPENKISPAVGSGTAAIGQSTATRSNIDTLSDLHAEPQLNAYAVAIGIENYRNLPKSEYSENDAVWVRNYLVALGFQERNIDLLTNEKATKTDIEKSIEAWLPNRVENGTVFIYFSGHGAPDPATGEAYIVPYDGDPNYLAVTGYPLKRLYDRLGKLQAKKIIVVLDSCFSGSGGRSVLAKGARPLVMMAPAENVSSNMAVLTATQGSQISTSSSEKKHGVFTYYFLKAIKDGKRDLFEIYDTIKPQVEDEAKRLNVQQSPSINPDAEKLEGRFNLSG
ncbi:MAG: caspase family protein [Desulfobacterales bacterium]|jgi:hypothetical protein